MSDRSSSSILLHCSLHLLIVFLFDDFPEAWVVEHLILHAAVHQEVVASLAGNLGCLLLHSPDLVVQVAAFVL